MLQEHIHIYILCANYPFFQSLGRLFFSGRIPLKNCLNKIHNLTLQH